MGAAYNSFGSMAQYVANQIEQNIMAQAQMQQQHGMGMPGNYLIDKSKEEQVLKKKGIMKLFRDYLEAHRDTIFTLILILLADHFVFKGAFSETIKAAFSKLLDAAHKKIDNKIEAKS